jgi:hypothetical protein
MTMQAHRWFAVDILTLSTFSHESTSLSFVVRLAIRLPGESVLTNQQQQLFPLDERYSDRVEIPCRGEK